jgi:asparagine synthetase B (glutamine-hydrolysing)
MNHLIGQIYADQSWQSWTPEDSARRPAAGEFLILLKNSHGQICGAVRDPLGQMPAYFTKNALGEIIIENSLQKILARTSDQSIHWDAVFSIWADNYESTSSSVFTKISKIPAGHLLYKKDSEWRTRPFFQELKASAADLTETFEHVVAERAQTTAPFSLLLSGGFDSSLLYALLQKQNFNPHAVVLDFKQGEESESKNILALEKKYPGKMDVLFAEDLDENCFAWQGRETYFYSPTLNLFKPLAERARRRGSRFLWTGLGADEVFVRDESLLISLLQSGEIKSFAKAWKNKSHFGRSHSALLFSVLREFLPSDLREKLSRLAAAASDLKLPQVKHFAQLRRQHRLQERKKSSNNLLDIELHERLFKSGQIAFCCEQEQALAEIYQMQFCYPFLDLRLVACSLEKLPRFFHSEGLDKFALRSTFSQILPSEIALHDSTQAYDGWQMRQMALQKTRIQKYFEGTSSHHEAFNWTQLLSQWNADNFKSKNDFLLKYLFSLQIQTWS